MGSVSFETVMTQLMSMDKNLDNRTQTIEDRLTKLNKYVIGKMVEFEIRSKQHVSDTKTLQDALDNLTLKYESLCDRIAKCECDSLLNNVPNRNKITEDNFMEGKNKCDRDLILSTVTEVIKQHGLYDDVSVVQKDVNSLKQKNMTNDIIVTGIPEQENEILLQSINKILSKHEITLKDSEVKKIYRLRNKNTLLNSPILVELKNDSMKSIILQKQKLYGPVLLDELDESFVGPNLRKIYFKDRLTRENLILLRESRNYARMNGFKYVWVQDGTILMKYSENSRPIKISSRKDFENLIT